MSCSAFCGICTLARLTFGGESRSKGSGESSRGSVRGVNLGVTGEREKPILDLREEKAPLNRELSSSVEEPARVARPGMREHRRELLE